MKSGEIAQLIYFPRMGRNFLVRHKYNEFVLCLRKEGGDEDACKVARQAALSLCPEEWVSFLFLSTSFF